MTAVTENNDDPTEPQARDDAQAGAKAKEPAETEDQVDAPRPSQERAKGPTSAQGEDTAKADAKAKAKTKAKTKAKDKAKDKAEAEEPPQPKVEPRLLVAYRNNVAPALQEQFRYKNRLQIPRVRKIVVNMGVGKAIENKSRLEHAARELAAITGQKPIVNRARKSIATFKLREGYPIGCSVTLRGARMWEFMDRLVAIAVPRIRDFRGLRRKLDGRGNYTMGLSEQSVFSEIDLDRVEFVQGMDITFVTTAKTDEEGLALLQGLGMPFRK